jgi:hypothetical protein
VCWRLQLSDFDYISGLRRRGSPASEPKTNHGDKFQAVDARETFSFLLPLEIALTGAEFDHRVPNSVK